MELNYQKMVLTQINQLCKCVLLIYGRYMQNNKHTKTEKPKNNEIKTIYFKVNCNTR